MIMFGEKKAVNASVPKQKLWLAWLAGMCHLRPAAAAAARDRSGRRNSLSHHSMRLSTQNLQRSSTDRPTATAERNDLHAATTCCPPSQLAYIFSSQILLAGGRRATALLHLLSVIYPS